MPSTERCSFRARRGQMSVLVAGVVVERYGFLGYKHSGLHLGVRIAVAVEELRILEAAAADSLHILPVEAGDSVVA